MVTFYKYQGAGNDFLIADNRDGLYSPSAEEIAALCNRRYGIGADGLMLLEQAPAPYDYRMVYYNADGSGGMMCGNGGRCMVAFADRCGIRSHRFIAADGPHHARILARNGLTLIVELGMKDVDEIITCDGPDINGVFLDTGTRHLVVEVPDIDACDVEGEGRRLRWRNEFAPVGTNVNFVCYRDGVLHVRTFEKGVEGETFACGTGITAAAIAQHHSHGAPTTHRVHIDIRALRDDLAVEFIPTPTGATDVSLIGPATLVAKVEPA